MATFPLRVKYELMDRLAQRRLARIAVETGGDMPDRKPKSKLPGDAMTLRGVPFIGPGVPGGVIQGTQPEHEAVKRLSRDERVQARIRELSEGV